MEFELIFYSAFQFKSAVCTILPTLPISFDPFSSHLPHFPLSPHSQSIRSLQGFYSDRSLKVARTIADLAGDEELKPGYVGEAIQYRTIDRMQ